MTAAAVYVLCALTSVACVVLLVRGFLRTRARLLFWSSLCFAGLAAQNILLFVDLVVVPDVDLSIWRNAAALTGLCCLLFAMIWEDP